MGGDNNTNNDSNNDNHETTTTTTNNSSNQTDNHNNKDKTTATPDYPRQRWRAPVPATTSRRPAQMGAACGRSSANGSVWL